MATKKTAVGKTETKKRIALTFPNVIPLCVQIEHSDGVNPPGKRGPRDGTRQALRLSPTGNRFPNSVYFMYQDASCFSGGGAYVELDNGFFVGHPYTGSSMTFQLPVDPISGRTEVVILDPTLMPAAGTFVTWKHHHPSRTHLTAGSGGGIIIQG